ncbi:probable oligoribonuclease isoform X1 [Pogonomyrmex barbatus]|uniref:Probable oligoribonuclease n=1 Tax=Pogonomyrmex barbatus TaxID=144034 RepID=A0A6I9WED9_9HYME|nr:probable oligoribonuclease isoform X1 [Pogonomyrmex barbatus]XP_011640861.1 probable oligoribonuclease isoform X1 [Pogonomyrmex barbatus]XP_011640862.1 probable oligoribonuclease isoform X1 [Pogonomyrmex barbatus]XP_011640864.1 probable oligoribonuclease isoform X1 [Pogonomyrmex barbatus]
MASRSNNYIVWIDMEMTGLEVDKDHILEIACIVTDEKLNIISEELNIVIHQSDIILENMNAWCKENHKKTGLIEKSRSSTITIEEAENIVLNFLKKYTEKDSCPLAGNTVYMDRLFLYKYMPSVNNYLHYRIIDVSTVKELVKRWNPDVYKSIPRKRLRHRALDDIRESIDELKYYKRHIFGL